MKTYLHLKVTNDGCVDESLVNHSGDFDGNNLNNQIMHDALIVFY